MFLLDCDLPFHFPNIFQRTKILDFNETQLSKLLFFVFCVVFFVQFLPFVSYQSNLCLPQGH